MDQAYNSVQDGLGNVINTVVYTLLYAQIRFKDSSQLTDVVLV